MFIFITLGIVTSIFQLVLLREFNFSIAKNELAFIIAAGFWIIFCAIGSLIKAPKKFNNLALSFFSSLCFFLTISGIHLLKTLCGIKYYETPSLSFILMSGIILIGPNALILGNIFKQLVREHLKASTTQPNTPAKFFAFEAIGFFIGGITFATYLNNYTNPLLFAILPILLILTKKKKDNKIIAVTLVAVLILLSSKIFNPILKKEFKNADITANLGSHYGPIIITNRDKVTAIFSSGSLLASSEDKSSIEEFIHTSLSALRNFEDKDILFIGAALSGQIEEILKYSPNSIDCLQLDPIITKLSKENLLSFENKTMRFITDDPARYLKNNNKLYDAVLLSEPAPSSLSLNRYFTIEFFKLIKRKIKPNGIFSFYIPSKREILSPQFAKFNSAIINAAEKTFRNRLLIPSDSMFIIASDDIRITKPLLLDNFTKAKINTSFFTYYHLKDSLDPSLSYYTESMLDKNIKPNAYLNPTGFLNYLILEQIKFYPRLRIDFMIIKRNIFVFLIFVALVILLIHAFFKKTSSILNIWALGFTSISLSSIIYALFQIYCNTLFWKLGLLISFFMIGLSIGAFAINKLEPKKLCFISISYICWASTILILLVLLKKINSIPFKEGIFYIYSFIFGVITGGTYPILAKDLEKKQFNKKNITTIIYSADLTGAFLGTLSCGILLIPFLGITSSLAVILILNLIFLFKNFWN